MKTSMKIWWKFSKALAKELRENWQILKTNKSYMNEILNVLKMKNIEVVNSKLMKYLK